MDLRKIAFDNDNNDTIKSFKSRFVNNLNEIYLDGNSLGKLPKKTHIILKNIKSRYPD